MKRIGMLAMLALLLAGSASAQQQVQPVSGVLTLSLAPGNNSFKTIISANITSVVFTNPTPGTTATVIFTENSTGGFSVTFGGNITNACTVATNASATTVCTFTYDASSNTWIGGGSGGGASPSSLTTFFGKSYGKAPQDYGAFMDFKVCYDINVSGQPTAIITSSSSKTLTNSSRTSNVITYTFSNTNAGQTTTPLVTPGQSITVTGSNNANGALNVTNVAVLSATATNITVASVGANVASAADTGALVTTVGCMNFNSSRDVGKVIEMKGVGAAGALLSTTILSVQSATQATLAANATTNATLQKAWSCHDDTTPLQSWVTDINNGIPLDSPLSGGTVLNHAGYVPGLGCTTKPLRFINPLGNIGFCGNCGFGTPEPFSGNNAGESLYLTGNGVYRSGFVALSTFNFTLNPTLNDGIFYMQNWNGSQIMNIAVLEPDSSIALSTAGNTGVDGCIVSDTNAHNTFIGWQVENCNNGGTLNGFADVGTDYGSNYENAQFYGNNYNIYLQAPTNASSKLFTDVHFKGLQLFSPTGTAAGGGNVIFDAQSSPVPFSNVGFSDTSFSNGCDGTGSSNGISNIVFRSGVIVSDVMQISNSRICDASTANGFGIAILTGAVSGEVDLNGTWLGQLSTTSNAAFSPFFIQPTGWAIKMFGGSLNKGATNLTNLGTVPTSSRVYINGAANNTGATAFAGTGATTGTWVCFESAASCSGPGNLGSSSYTFAGTQTLPTGTGACATITTNTGGASGGQATCTGTTGASTFIITPGSTAAHGWVCFASDQTTAANTLRQSANSPTTCTIAGTVNANDVLTFGAFAY